MRKIKRNIQKLNSQKNKISSNVKKTAVLAGIALAVSLSMGTACFAIAPNTLPTNPVVIQNTTVTSNTNTMNVQTTGGTNSVGEVHFGDYSIGSSATVNYEFTAAGQASLNRVTGSNPSQIFGKITQSGQGGAVFLINPNGMLFGQGSSVNVDSFAASTLDVSQNNLSDPTRTLELARNGDPKGIYLQGAGDIKVIKSSQFSSNAIYDNGKNICAGNGNIGLITGDGVTYTLDSNGAITTSHHDVVASNASQNLVTFANGATATLGSITTKGGSITGGNIKVIAELDKDLLCPFKDIINIDSVLAANSTIATNKGVYILANNEGDGNLNVKTKDICSKGDVVIIADGNVCTGNIKASDFVGIGSVSGNFDEFEAAAQSGPLAVLELCAQGNEIKTGNITGDDIVLVGSPIKTGDLTANLVVLLGLDKLFFELDPTSNEFLTFKFLGDSIETGSIATKTLIEIGSSINNEYIGGVQTSNSPVAWTRPDVYLFGIDALNLEVEGTDPSKVEFFFAGGNIKTGQIIANNLFGLGSSISTCNITSNHDAILLGINSIDLKLNTDLSNVDLDIRGGCVNEKNITAENVVLLGSNINFQDIKAQNVAAVIGLDSIELDSQINPVFISSNLGGLVQGIEDLGHLNATTLQNLDYGNLMSLNINPVQVDGGTLADIKFGYVGGTINGKSVTAEDAYLVGSDITACSVTASDSAHILGINSLDINANAGIVENGQVGLSVDLEADFLGGNVNVKTVSAKDDAIILGSDIKTDKVTAGDLAVLAGVKSLYLNLDLYLDINSPPPITFSPAGIVASLRDGNLALPIQGLSGISVDGILDFVGGNVNAGCVSAKDVVALGSNINIGKITASNLALALGITEFDLNVDTYIGTIPEPSFSFGVDAELIGGNVYIPTISANDAIVLGSNINTTTVNTKGTTALIGISSLNVDLALGNIALAGLNINDMVTAVRNQNLLDLSGYQHFNLYDVNGNVTAKTITAGDDAIVVGSNIDICSVSAKDDVILIGLKSFELESGILVNSALELNLETSIRGGNVKAKTTSACDDVFMFGADIQTGNIAAKGDVDLVGLKSLDLALNVNTALVPTLLDRTALRNMVNPENLEATLLTLNNTHPLNFDLDVSFGKISTSDISGQNAFLLGSDITTRDITVTGDADLVGIKSADIDVKTTQVVDDLTTGNELEISANIFGGKVTARNIKAEDALLIGSNINVTKTCLSDDLIAVGFKYLTAEFESYDYTDPGQTDTCELEVQFRGGPVNIGTIKADDVFILGSPVTSKSIDARGDLDIIALDSACFHSESSTFDALDYPVLEDFKDSSNSNLSFKLGYVSLGHLSVGGETFILSKNVKIFN